MTGRNPHYTRAESVQVDAGFMRVVSQKQAKDVVYEMRNLYGSHADWNGTKVAMRRDRARRR